MVPHSTLVIGQLNMVWVITPECSRDYVSMHHYAVNMVLILPQLIKNPFTITERAMNHR